MAPGLGGATRKELDELTDRARRFGAKGLVHLVPSPEGLRGPAAKFLSDDTQRAIVERTGAGEGDLILAIADAPAVTADVLGRLRAELGERLGLADPTVLAYVWVNRFPMYQWDEENGRWDATHNPFSGVVPEDEALLVTSSGDPANPSPDDPAGRARALQYDLTLNGWELGGGSVRIHRRDLLERSFLLQGRRSTGCARSSGSFSTMRSSTARRRTAGIALGIDRWAALLATETDIGGPRPSMSGRHEIDAGGAVHRPVRAVRGARAASSGRRRSRRPDRRWRCRGVPVVVLGVAALQVDLDAGPRHRRRHRR